MPSIRSRRAVSNGGLLLSVAYDLTCFMRFFERYKLCLENGGTAESELGEPGWEGNAALPVDIE